MKEEIKNYVSEQQRSYDQEKLMQKSKLILVKENEFSQVNRLINSNYKDLHQMEFDTIFKMYKIQEYSFTPQLFVGTAYKYGSLSAIRSMVKAATHGIKDYATGNSGYDVIYSFINDVKKYSKPFPFIFNERKNAVHLLTSGTLTEDEQAFLRSEIKSYRKPATKEERETKPTKLKESKNMKINKKAKITDEEKRQIFNIIVHNYNRPLPTVRALVREISSELKPATINVYTAACKRLERGVCVTSQLSKIFLDEWNNRNTTVPVTTNTHNSNTESKLKDIKSTNKDVYAVISNDKLLKMADSLEFLRGFLDGIKTISSDNAEIKIYKITEIS